MLKLIEPVKLIFGTWEAFIWFIRFFYIDVLMLSIFSILFILYVRKYLMGLKRYGIMVKHPNMFYKSLTYIALNAILCVILIFSAHKYFLVKYRNYRIPIFIIEALEAERNGNFEDAIVVYEATLKTFPRAWQSESRQERLKALRKTVKYSYLISKNSCKTPSILSIPYLLASESLYRRNSEASESLTKISLSNKKLIPLYSKMLNAIAQNKTAEAKNYLNKIVTVDGNFGFINQIKMHVFPRRNIQDANRGDYKDSLLLTQKVNKQPHFLESEYPILKKKGQYH